MFEVVIGVIGTLLGIGITISAGWLGQRRAFARSAKRELYAQFIVSLWLHNAKNNQEDTSTSADFKLLVAGTQIILYGSDRVIRALAEVMKLRGSIGLVGKNKIVELTLAMRDDLGLGTNSDLSSEVNDILFERAQFEPPSKG